MHEARIFELDATILERVIFAMEDQSKSNVIELSTGNLIDRPEGILPSALAEPPEWTPADGFALMERFCSHLTDAALKRELQTVLSLGKGVFKKFRLVLAGHPEAERRFREFKNAVLRFRVESWMDDIRESLGLERLGQEPEEFEDLHDEELVLLETSLKESRFDIEKIVDTACEEAESLSNPGLAKLERHEILSFLKGHLQDGLLMHFDDADGNPMAVAVAAMEKVPGASLGIIRFIFVKPDFRSLDLELKLIARMDAALSELGANAVLVRCAYLRPACAENFAERGILSAGSQYIIS